MSIPSPFDAFTEQAHTERIAIELTQLIADDAVFSAWAGDRVFRLTGPEIEPDTEVPAIWVAAVGEQYGPQIGKGEMEVDMLVTFLYEERRLCLSESEGNLEDADASRLTRRLLTLVSKYRFETNRFVNGVPLVEGLTAHGRVAYDATIRRQPSVIERRDDETRNEFLDRLRESGGEILHYLTYGLTYVYTVDPTTFEARGFA